MAGSINKVILIGNLGRDPEVRFGPDGSKIVNMSIATSESWKDKSSGERKERTEWHRVVIFNDALAGIAEKYLRKGSKIYLEGQLQTRKWTDQQGQEKYTTEIMLGRYRGELTLLDAKGEAGSTGQQQDNNFDTSPRGSSQQWGSGTENESSSAPSSSPKFDDLNDEIPF